MSKRLAGRYGYPADQPFAITTHTDRLDEPLHWRKPSRIFVCSMGDLFHDDVPGRFINEVWTRMFNTPRHTFLVLTKRPLVLFKWTFMAAKAKAWPVEDIWPAHIALGVTAENQDAFNERVPALMKIPCQTTFISVEPMLEPIDIGGWHPDWLICGGESGPGRRTFDTEWGRGLRDQCKEAGVPFFFKQVDKVRPIPDDLMIRQYPEAGTITV